MAEEQKWADATLHQLVLSSVNSRKGFDSFKKELSKRVREWKNQ